MAFYSKASNEVFYTVFPAVTVVKYFSKKSGNQKTISENKYNETPAQIQKTEYKNYNDKGVNRDFRPLFLQLWQ